MREVRMSEKIQLDIISDVVCPWCIIGYKNLQLAINELNIADKIDLQWQPFELNPNMPAEGQNLREHITEKYGSSIEESNQARTNLSNRGLQVGFIFNFFEDMKIVNTRDAHIMLEYAHESGKQTALKLRLFSAIFTEQKDISDRDSLLKEVSQIGLDIAQAKVRLDEEHFREELVKHEMHWQQLGVSAVPTIVFNRSSAISGAQSVETYKQVLTELLTE
jgi:predicted DsbA family dithiol-disulfide isomerase